MKDAYIATSVRTPGCRKEKGAFKETLPQDLIAFILNAAVEKTSNLENNDIEDVMIGCAFPEAEQGLNIGRISAQMAGFPDSVTGSTINRFCASGLEAIALTAMKIMTGMQDIGIGGGVESMTRIPLGGHLPRPHPEHSRNHAKLYMSMGLTAENIARRYGISREEQDHFAYRSHMKASEAKMKNMFSELIPTPAITYRLTDNGTYKKGVFIQDFDDGIRDNTSIERLSQLPAVFAAGGSVTAGNASQMTDGAAATVLMSKEKIDELGLSPIAKFRDYVTVGCEPDMMGIGPRYAIPKLLDRSGLSIEDIGVWEINEAFASQILYCLKELGLHKYDDRININGGAIALGHPLGCTGAKLTATLLANMERKDATFGVVSMCVGGGMGAAALFERTK